MALVTNVAVSFGKCFVQTFSLGLMFTSHLNYQTAKSASRNRKGTNLGKEMQCNNDLD